MRGRSLRLILAGGGLLLAVAAVSVLLAARGSSETVALAGTEIQGSPAAPAFRLHDADGRPVALRQLRGKVVFVTFLYVHCPDVCPLIASHVNDALRTLGPDASAVAVSVDPEGDTPAAVRSYVADRRLLPRFHYLRGTRAELAPVWKRWFVGATPARDEVLHTSMTVLVDRDGRQRVRYGAGATAAQLVHDVRALKM